MKKILSVACIMFFLPSHILAATPVEALAKVGVKVIASPNIQTDQDSWIQPEDQSTVTDSIDYWIDRLPKEEDKQKNSYMVIPKLGVVAPINSVSSSNPDFEKIKYWKTFDINKYLQSWVFKYPMTALPGHKGNGVFFGHSSYWHKDSWRYKTIFTTIPLLTKWDVIWLYTRWNEGWAFTKHVYEVTLSYDTSPSDVGVMMATPWATITLVGCTDIGRADGRWIVKATLNNKLTSQVVSNRINTPIVTEGETETWSTTIDTPSVLPGMETGDNQTWNNQTWNNQTVTISQPLTISAANQTRLDQYIVRINKLSPEGKKRIINRFTKYFIHVRNNMPDAQGLANYIADKLWMI